MLWNSSEQNEYVKRALAFVILRVELMLFR